MNIRKLSSPWSVLALLCLAYSFSFFQRVCPAVLSMDLMRDLHLDASTFGLIGSATWLGYALTQIPSGLLADIFGARKTISCLQILSGLFCIAFAFCGSLAPAVAVRFFLGLTLACNVPAYKLFAEIAPANRYALFCSILTGCSSIGAVLASSPLALASNLAGWRPVLIAVGLFTLFLGLFIYASLADPAKRMADLPARRKLADLGAGLLTIARMKNYWLIVLWFMLMTGNLFTLLTTWWGAYLMQGAGLNQEAAALSLTIMAFSPLPFLLIFPWLSDNVFHSRKIFLMLASLIECAALGHVCLLDQAPGFAWLTITGCAINIATTAMGPLTFTMVKESAPPQALASACGFMNCTAPAISAVMQMIFGAILAWRLDTGDAPATAYAGAFWLLLGAGILSLAAALLMKDTWKAAENRP